MLRTLIGFIFAVGAMPLCAYAQISWPNKLAQVSVKASDQQAIAQFAFTNTGEYPVTITRVRCCCGMRIGTLDKKTFGPGEGAAITITVNTATLSGRVRKTAYVETDDPRRSNAPLQMLIIAPALVNLDPEELLWEAGDRSEKALSIKVTDEQPLKITSVDCSDGRVSAQLTVIREGEEYRVVLRPEGELPVGVVQLILKTDLKSGGEARRIEVDLLFG